MAPSLDVTPKGRSIPPPHTSLLFGHQGRRRVPFAVPLLKVLRQGKQFRQQSTACIGVARILSGCTFSSKKLTFLVVAFKRRFKTTNWSSNSTPRSKNVLKLTLALPGGACTWCAGDALTNFPRKLRLKVFFLSALGVPVHPLHP